MAAKLNKFQMVGFDYWKGLTKETHLGALGQIEVAAPCAASCC